MRAPPPSCCRARSRTLTSSAFLPQPATRTQALLGPACRGLGSSSAPSCAGSCRRTACSPCATLSARSASGARRRRLAADRNSRALTLSLRPPCEPSRRRPPFDGVLQLRQPRRLGAHHVPDDLHRLRRRAGRRVPRATGGHGSGSRPRHGGVVRRQRSWRRQPLRDCGVDGASLSLSSVSDARADPPRLSSFPQLFFTAPFLWARMVLPIEQMEFPLMAGVTIVFIVGYSWLDTHYAVLISSGVGADLAWKVRLSLGPPGTERRGEADCSLSPRSAPSSSSSASRRASSSCAVRRPRPRPPGKVAS